jgi:cell fate (sporulation/competence/biofilm development) regulator YlbF (YheA/YmcA/DUF963 family)
MEAHVKRGVAVDKGIAMKTQISTLPDSLLAATSALTENLMQSEPFVRYQDADRKLRADQKAMRLLDELSELQQEVRDHQYSGNISENEVNLLRKLQSEVNTNEVIQEHGYAQEIAVAFLREVNKEISNLLSVDFASLTRRSGGCC